MSIIIKRGKRDGVFVFYDDDTDEVVGRYTLEHLRQEQKHLAQIVKQLDIVDKNAKLLEWARMMYPQSGEGQALSSHTKQLAEVESKITAIEKFANG